MLTVTAIILLFGPPAALCFAIAFLQHRKKGPPMVNQWLWLSKAQRAKVHPDEKKLYYRLGRNCFAGLGLCFMIPNGYILSQWSGVWHVTWFAFVVVMFYAFFESIRILSKNVERQKNEKN